MNRNVVLAFTAGVAVTFIIEELRAIILLLEFQRRFAEQEALTVELAEIIDKIENGS